MHVMAKMDAKCGPLKSGDFGDIGKNGNLDGVNGEKSPEGWQFKLDAKRSPLESDDFGDNGENGEIGDFCENG